MVNKYTDQTAEEYHNNTAVGHSRLALMSKSPLHYKLGNPPCSTQALIFGSAFHTMVLQPELFKQCYTVRNLDMRKRDDRAFAEAETSAGRQIISEDDYSAICEMRNNILFNKYARALLKGEKEVSYYWTDEMTGIDCKCRPDCRTDLKSTSVIVDLKSCVDASTEAFSKKITEIGYDLQVAMYRTGVELYEHKPHKFVFIAVEKNPPYAVNILEVDDLIYKKGLDDMRYYLGLLKECTDSNKWYDYTGKDGIPNVASLPAWLVKEYE